MIVVVFETIDTGREAAGVERPEVGGTGNDLSFFTTTGDVVAKDEDENLGGDRESSSS